MAAESEFIDPGDFLVNRSIPDIETSLRIHMKESIYLYSYGQETIKCEDRWPIITRKNIR